MNIVGDPRDVSRAVRRTAPERHRSTGVGARRLATTQYACRRYCSRTRPTRCGRPTGPRTDRHTPTSSRRVMERTDECATRLADRRARRHGGARSIATRSNRRPPANQASGAVSRRNSAQHSSDGTRPRVAAATSSKVLMETLPDDYWTTVRGVESPRTSDLLRRVRRVTIERPRGTHPHRRSCAGFILRLPRHCQRDCAGGL